MSQAPPPGDAATVTIDGKELTVPKGTLIIRAAEAVGDDTIQKNTQGYVMPDSFTHGSAAQRMQYFQKGFQSGDMHQCQTFR